MLLARPQYFQLEPQQQKPIRHQRNFHRPPRKKNKIKKNSKRLIKSLHEWQCRRKRLANKRPQHWSSDIKRVRPRERERKQKFSRTVAGLLTLSCLKCVKLVWWVWRSKTKTSWIIPITKCERIFASYRESIVAKRKRKQKK